LTGLLSSDFSALQVLKMVQRLAMACLMNVRYQLAASVQIQRGAEVQFELDAS
jgi:hypothetical protein